MSESCTSPMRFEICPTCAVIFALPMELYLHKLSNAGSIHCPSGHTIKLSISNVETNSGIVKMCSDLQRDNHQLHHDLRRAKELLALIPQTPQGPITAIELKRRCEVLAARAEHVEYGRSLCRFCGKPQSANYKLRDHLRRCHAVDVAELPLSEFE